MKTLYTLLLVGAEPTSELIDLPEDPSYEQLRALLLPLLDCEHPEHVNVLYRGRQHDMFVDEMGHLRHLPRNEHATTIYRAATLEKDPAIPPECLDWIAGPAVLFHRKVWL